MKYKDTDLNKKHFVYYTVKYFFYHYLIYLWKNLSLLVSFPCDCELLSEAPLDEVTIYAAQSVHYVGHCWQGAAAERAFKYECDSGWMRRWSESWLGLVFNWRERTDEWGGNSENKRQMLESKNQSQAKTYNEPRYVM